LGFLCSCCSAPFEILLIGLTAGRASCHTFLGL